MLCYRHARKIPSLVCYVTDMLGRFHLWCVMLQTCYEDSISGVLCYRHARKIPAVVCGKRGDQAVEPQCGHTAEPAVDHDPHELQQVQQATAAGGVGV